MSPYAMWNRAFSRSLTAALIAVSPSLSSCSSDDEPDGGPSDAGATDVGVPYDGGFLPDAVVGPDTGPRDVGFSDPDVIFQGLEVINNLRTYVVVMRTAGTTTSTMPTAILLHSGPAISHEYLLPHMKSILPGRLMVLYDMRATGRSAFGPITGSSTITAAQHATDLGDLIDWANQRWPSPKVDLVGHGYGAGIAALYAAQHPDKVSRLVLTAPYPPNIQLAVQARAELERRLTPSERERFFALIVRPECRGDDSGCFLMLWNISGPHMLCPTNRDKFRELNFMHGSYRAQAFVEDQLRNSRYDWSGELGRIRAPTTIISGPCDPNPPESALVYTSSISGSVHHVLPNTGHFPMVEDPAAYNAILRAALVYP